MKVKQSDIIRLYPALETLAGYSMPINTAWKVYQTLCAVKDLFQFGINEEMKTAEKHGGKLDKAGRFAFESKEAIEKYKEEMDSIFKFEVELDIEPFNIKLSELGNINISPKTICDLSPVVNFI